MTTEVGLVNLALVKIGETRISALADNTRQAREANAIYEPTRDALLSSYNWKFTLTRAEVTVDASAPTFGFSMRYALPADCLRFIGLYDANEPLVNYTSTPEPHKVESGYVLTDVASPAQIFYVKKITDPASFDPLFVQALSLQLAVDLAYALTTGLERVPQLERQFDQMIRRARHCDAIQGQPEHPIASEWVDARMGGASTNPYSRAWSNGGWW